jgi:hypothetical protein
VRWPATLLLTVVLMATPAAAAALRWGSVATCGFGACVRFGASQCWRHTSAVPQRTSVPTVMQWWQRPFLKAEDRRRFFYRKVRKEETTFLCQNGCEDRIQKEKKNHPLFFFSLSLQKNQDVYYKSTMNGRFSFVNAILGRIK